MTVLIAEDDPSVQRFLKQAISEAGYATETTGDGARTLQLARTGAYDLIVLDVMLPTLDGFEITRRLREGGLTTPILMITALDTMEDKIAGLDSGADDYIVKPFQVAELLARVRALMRRSAVSTTLLQTADLTLNPMARMVARGGKPIHLSTTEFALLEYLMRHSGKTITRHDILQHIWQYDFGGNDNILDVYISYLRRKIDKKPFSGLDSYRAGNWLLPRYRRRRIVNYRPCLLRPRTALPFDCA